MDKLSEASPIVVVLLALVSEVGKLGCDKWTLLGVLAALVLLRGFVTLERIFIRPKT